MALLIGSLQLGFIYGILALGIYITFRILKIPDLTAEGSFTLGMAVSTWFAMRSHPLAGIFAGFLAGAAAGSVTGLLQTKLRIHSILAGILTMSGLYSISMYVMNGASNVSLLTGTTFYKQMFAAFDGVDKDIIRSVISVVFLLVVLLLLIFFFKTRLGLCIRATGDNEDMVKASSINADGTKILALAISNGCIALAGGLLAQYQGFFDISSGTGILAVGLASVIIGEVFGGKNSLTAGMITAAVGAVVYRYIIAFALKYNFFEAYMLKLVSAIIVAIALSIPAIQYYAGVYRIKHKKQGPKGGRN